MSRPLLLIALLTLPAAALAAPDDGGGAASVRAAFGNTIVSTYPDGRRGELWLAPGGTYTAEGRRGDRSGGHWSVKGEKLCLKQSHPIPIPFSFCTPIPKAGMGQAWSAKAQTGEPITVEVVKGHVAGKAQARTAQPPASGG
jgi:hypothetical protein